MYIFTYLCCRSFIFFVYTVKKKCSSIFCGYTVKMSSSIHCKICSIFSLYTVKMWSSVFSVYTVKNLKFYTFYIHCKNVQFNILCIHCKKCSFAFQKLCIFSTSRISQLLYNYFSPCLATNGFGTLVKKFASVGKKRDRFWLVSRLRRYSIFVTFYTIY